MIISACCLCNRSIDKFYAMYVELPGENVACPNCAQQIGIMLSSKPLMQQIYQKLKTPSISYEIQDPKEIYKGLSQYIIGQDKAKKILSVAAYNHYIRVKSSDKQIEKSNVLLLGPSGCGKTSLIKALSKILKVPLAITSATTLTEAGYIGNDVESVVQNLFHAAKENLEYAERGIIFIDEIDKLSSTMYSQHHQVGRKGVQQALLSILEGGVISIQYSSGMKDTAKIDIDTSNILFICGGAFPGIEEIINKRISQRPVIGFTPNDQRHESITNESTLENINTDDLISFGLIPEIIGRLPIIATMEKLSINDLVDILTNPKNSLISQYQALFAHNSIDLVFEPDALETIANMSLERGTGARALRSILEETLLDLMFNISRNANIQKVIIKKDFVLGISPPIEIKKEATVQPTLATL